MNVTGMNMDVTGVNMDVTGMNMDVAGVNMDVTAVDIDVAGVKMDVTGVNMDVAGVNMDVTGVNMDVTGVDMDVAGVNIYLGVNMDVPGMNMDVTGVNIYVGVNMDVARVNMDVPGVDMDVTGVNMNVAGVNMDVAGVNMDVTGVNIYVGMNMGVTGVNMDVAGVDMDVAGVNMDVTGVNMDVTGVAASVIPCPGGPALLNREFSITGNTSNYTGFTWTRPKDGRYVVTCNPSCSPVTGYRATRNDTHSTLTIVNVATTDVGTWNTSDAVAGDAVRVSVCHLMVMKIPQCTISSDEDTDSLEPGTQLTLTVDITGYYCSGEAGFDLTTGDVTEQLGMRHNVSGVTDSVFNRTFSTGPRHLGNVTLNYICDTNKTLTCNGVQMLLEKGQSSSTRSPPVTEDPDRAITLGIAIGFSLLGVLLFVIITVLVVRYRDKIRLYLVSDKKEKSPETNMTDMHE